MKKLVFILTCAALVCSGLVAFIALHFIDATDDEKKRAQTAAARQARHAPKNDVQPETVVETEQPKDDSEKQIS